MSLDLEVFRPWWTGDAGPSSADRRRIEELLDAHRFWDAYKLSEQLGGSPDDALLESFEALTGEIFFIGRFFEVYGDHEDLRATGDRLLRPFRAGAGVFQGKALETLVRHLLWFRDRGQHIFAPTLDDFSAEPAYPGRWLIYQEPADSPGRSPWALFIEKEDFVFYSGSEAREPWPVGEAWDEGRALRMGRPVWDPEGSSYRDASAPSDREFPLPYVQDEIRRLEADGWSLDPSGTYFVDPDEKNAALPSHPLWQGEPQVLWRPVLDVCEEALGVLESASELARREKALFVLGSG